MDGFRCLAFRDGDKVELQSKAGQSLTRYFPEIVEGLRGLKASRFVFDGELVTPVNGALSFDDLLQRIHPAESRVRKLAAATPALLIVFDLLADERGKSLLKLTLAQRRKLLETFAKKYFKDPCRLSPATTDAAEAKKWFSGGGASLDGIIAKRTDLPYQSGERTGTQKIKAFHTADCVVGGFRYAEKKPVVGSLLLGLYDKDGLLHHVGFCSGIKAEEKPALTRKLEKLVQPPGFTGCAALRVAPVAGARGARRNGSRSSLSSLRRSPTITSAASGFGTGRGLCDGVQTNRRSNARWNS